MGNPERPDLPAGGTLLPEGEPPLRRSLEVPTLERDSESGTLVREAEVGTLVREGEASTLVRDPGPQTDGAAAAQTNREERTDRQRLTDSGSAPVRPPAHEAPVTREEPGRYQLRREFGRGGQAVVWLAHDEHIGRDVALKLMAPGGGSASELTRGTATVRFLREARITGQLEHPSIVPVYEVGHRADGSLYYTQKLVRGRTLRAALDACQGLPQRLALLSHFVDVCQAVAYAHLRGVVHRDLKPENIMVGEFGETVVLDWGLAKVKGLSDPKDRTARGHTPVELESPAGATRVGAILGTPLYMSPEQALGRLAEVDERSDVWALGAVLYEILAGRPPFLGQNPTQVLFKVANAPLEPVRKHCPDAPPELTAVAEHALNKDRAQRYGSAREVASEISAWQSGERVLAYSYTTWELAKKLARKNPLASTIAAAAIVVLIASSIIIWRAHAEAVSYLADALLARAHAAERENRWAYAAVWRAAARTHEDRTEARWGQELAEQLAIPPKARLLGHKGEVWGVAYVAGNLLASSSEDGTIRLWDGAGQTVATLHGHEGRVAALASSPGSPLLVSGGEDGTVRVWDVPSRRLLRTLEMEADVWTVALSPDGNTVAAAGVDHDIALWDTRSFAPLARLGGHDQDVSAVAFSPDGALLASSSTNGDIIIWDAKTRKVHTRLLVGGHEIWSLAFSTDSKSLVMGGDHGLLRVAPIASKRRRVLAGHTRIVSAAAFSPDGRLMATGSRDGSVRLWDGSTMTALTRLDAGDRAANSLTFSPDGRTLAVAHQDHSVRLWALPDQPGLQALAAHDADVRALAFSPDGARLASGAEDETVKLWDVARGKVLHDFGDVGGMPRSLSYSRDGKLLAVAAGDGKLRLYDAATFAPAGVLPGHKGFIAALQFSPVADLLVSAGEDGFARVWDMATRKLLREVHAPGKLHGVAISPDGTLLAGGGTDRLLHLWSTATGESVAAMPGHTETIRAVAFSPDGKVVASGGHDRTVRVYDVKHHKLLRVFNRHEGQVRALAFSRDGSVLGSACTDRELRLWEVRTGALLAELPWHETGVLALAWSADGRMLASGSGEGLVAILRVGDARELPPPDQSLRALLERHWLKMERLELVPALPGGPR